MIRESDTTERVDHMHEKYGVNTKQIVADRFVGAKEPISCLELSRCS
jgi:hypothetical protein